MLVRFLVLFMVSVSLYAQDVDDVSKYLQELRETKAPHDVQAEAREQLILLRQRLDETSNRQEKASLYMRISASEQVAGNPDAAIAAARNAHDLAPTDENAARSLAGLLLQNQQKAEVPALLGVDPSDGAALVREAARLGSGPLAMYCGELAYNLLPNDAKVADTLGMIYLRGLDAQKAQAVFREAELLAPQVATYHYHLGLAILQSGSRDSAESALKLALESNPSESERSGIENALARIKMPMPAQPPTRVQVPVKK